MSDKGKKVISAKINVDEAEWLEKYADTHNISISALMKLFIDSLVHGEMVVEKGELKTVVDPIGYAVSDDFEDRFGLKVDRKFDKLRKRGYPERFIEAMKEQILNGIDSQIDMLPKRFDARRMKDDCGC